MRYKWKECWAEFLFKAASGEYIYYCPFEDYVPLTEIWTLFPKEDMHRWLNSSELEVLEYDDGDCYIVIDMPIDTIEMGGYIFNGGYWTPCSTMLMETE